MEMDPLLSHVLFNGDKHMFCGDCFYHVSTIPEAMEAAVAWHVLDAPHGG